MYMKYMMKNGCRIGGEQNGHIIFANTPAQGMEFLPV